MNTNYSLREPSFDELRETFGTLGRAVQATGGDIALCCFYIANPELAAAAGEASKRDDRYAKELRIAAQQERDEAAAESAAAAWDAQPAERRRSIAEVMRQTGLGFEAAKRCLVITGRMPA